MYQYIYIVYIYIQMYVYIYIYVYTHFFMYILIFMHICIYICVRCLYMYFHMFVSQVVPGWEVIRLNLKLLADIKEKDKLIIAGDTVRVDAAGTYVHRHTEKHTRSHTDT